jgi:repressor LexA
MQQKELALTVGVAQPTVSEWESNKKDPSGDRLKKLSEIFGVDELVVLGKGVVDISETGISFIPLNHSIPIIGNIACSPQNEPDTNVDGYTSVPEGVRADFALKCKGDSMLPMFNDGDLVLMRKQPEVENGQVAAVSINGETTLKHVYKTENGLLLFANNPKYEPIQTKTEDDVLIFGLAVGYVRMF